MLLKLETRILPLKMYVHAQINGLVGHTPHCRWNLIAKRLRKTFSLHSSMDTIVPDSINRYDSDQLPNLFSLALREVRELVGPACEYNDDVLTQLKPASMLAPAQDREVRLG